jgi:hypothetical protein
MAKSPIPLPLSRVLASDATLAAWQARVAIETELTSTVRRHLPRALAHRVRVALAAENTLTLVTSSGAVAAVVRQRLPDILGELSREGCNFTEIKVRVQVRLDPLEPEKVLKIQRKGADPAPLRRLAATLPDGPLKIAIERLARRI